ncbi:MAG: VOC family protein [Desulfocapsaceae bacterium]
MIERTLPVQRFSRIVVTVLLAMSLSSLLSCASRMDIEVPALNAGSSGVHKPGKFVWFELITHDPDKVGAFYSDLFGWTFSPYAGNTQYLTIKSAENEIGGMVEVSDRSLGSRWISSLSVDDVDETALKVRKLGGRVLYGPADFDDRGKFAQVGDSQGADFIILKTRQGDPSRPEPAPGAIVWVELFTRSVEEAAQFYKGLIAYEVLPFKESDEHHYFAAGDKIRGGLTELEWDDVKPTWLPFVGVNNLREVVLKAIDSGGTLLAHTETAAVILDPGGAAVGLQLLPEGGVR